MDKEFNVKIGDLSTHIRKLDIQVEHNAYDVKRATVTT